MSSSRRTGLASFDWKYQNSYIGDFFLNVSHLATFVYVKGNTLTHTTRDNPVD